MRGLPTFSLPSLDECMELSLKTAQLTNPDAKFIGIAVNTSKMSAEEANAYLTTTEETTGLVTIDPVRQGVARIVDLLI